MTNEQTRVMLAGIVSELKAAYTEASSLIPFGPEREPSQTFMGKTVVGGYVALQPIRAIITALEERSEMLITTPQKAA